MKTFKFVSFLSVLVLLLSACTGVQGTFSFSGSVVFGAADVVTMKDGATATVLETATFTRDQVEIKLVQGQVIKAKGDVTIDFANKTILGEFEFLETTPVPSTSTSTPLATATSTTVVDATPSTYPGYTMNITGPGEFTPAVGWTWFYCTNSTPELASANGYAYKESDPLGTGPMWIGYAAPNEPERKFVVTKAIYDKMVVEAQGVALFCQFK